MLLSQQITRYSSKKHIFKEAAEIPRSMLILNRVCKDHICKHLRPSQRQKPTGTQDGKDQGPQVVTPFKLCNCEQAP